ncbi:MAG: hypothetical protein P4L71_19090 [Acetobacteraceae bacterium]|nr:hypothetical protein [Acetobacteraceae bacterium]
MSHIEIMGSSQYNSLLNLSIQRDNCNPLVLVVEGDADLFSEIALICDFLDLGVERVTGGDDLLAILDDRRPMAVIAELDGPCQDGCFVLMTVAAHDRSLPVLMITGEEAALIGAVDAVQELWGLGMVIKVPVLPNVGGLVDFLFRAGRKTGVSRLMPV